MRCGWKPYCNDNAPLVDTWLDAEAVRETGLEDGWQSYYAYWMAESRAGEGKDRCFLISQGNRPFAVMYIVVSGGEMVISEYVVAPDWRGKGHGSAILRELLDNAARLLNTEVSQARAVIFPDNAASVRAFEKAGFALESRNHDAFGESLNYAYRWGAAA